MRANVRRLSLALFVLSVATLFGGRTAAVFAQQKQQRVAPNPAIERGEALFRHVWKASDPLSPKGDGLGPMHNATSCLECHVQGGTGGGGNVSHNVQLLTVNRPRKEKDEDEKSFRKGFSARVDLVHKNFGAQSTVVFHRFGPGLDYQFWRESFWGVPTTLYGTQRVIALKSSQRHTAGKPISTLEGFVKSQNVSFQLSQRNTPALFGAGLIDTIPEETLAEVAKNQRQVFPGIAGRVGRTSTGAVGRFGWRGQVANLNDFVLNACAMELGLQTANHPQMNDPRGRQTATVEFDLSEQQCDDLFEFVTNLPRPQQIRPEDNQLSALLNHGEAMFQTVGCNACHLPRLGEVNGLFSDLLLHDMGPGLSDPAPAVPDKMKVGTVSTPSSGYGGGGSFDVFADLPTNIRREWRTPPLWGVADSAPYLHDGRAATLEQAILLHGGEGQASAGRFASLPTDSKNAILLYLNTLRAPSRGA